MTARLRKIVGWTAVILLPIAYVVGSEVHYARSISPHGVSTVRDFFDRFGEPRRVRMVQRDGQSYYEFTGRLPSGFALAAPSASPAYVFDEQGCFTAWCRDPGDIPSYRQTWPLQSTNHVEIGLIRERFGLQ
jgi:hypothetical protein